MTSIVFSSAYYFNNEVKINFDKFVGSTTGVVNIFFTDIGKKDKILKRQMFLYIIKNLDLSTKHGK